MDRRVCNAIIDKQNMHIEYSCVRKALLQYVNDIIRAQNQNSNTTYETKVLKVKSKLYYNDFICNKAFSLTVVRLHLHPYCIRNQIDERTVFNSHICCEKEKKLKEFNFKMLHGILSCGANLHKWKIRNSSVCDVCDQDQTIIHVLFECKHVERLLTSVREALGMNITQDSIICGCMDGNFYGNNVVITLVCFFIYNDWLIRSLDNKKRSVDFNKVRFWAVQN